jgi:S-adenosylmethionine:tRNA ribosyltransferase-isomerase
MRLSDFDFELPAERIALRPARPRDSARLLVVSGSAISDRSVRDLPEMLEPGDVLVFNDTKVIPAQLEGRRGEASIGATLHKREGPREWQAFLRNAKRVRPGDTIEFGENVAASLVEKAEDGSGLLHFHGDEPVELLLGRAGRMPLPPYIASRRAVDEADRSDYQTMFAREEGAVAAPTAALHFTPELLQALDSRGVSREVLTLHVGAGTFLPVKSERIDEHKLHAEWGRIDAPTAERLNAARAEGRRLISVGTTSLRLLESAADEVGTIHAFEGDTAIFITPGYRF